MHSSISSERYEIQNDLWYMQVTNRAQAEAFTSYQAVRAPQNSFWQALEFLRDSMLLKVCLFYMHLPNVLTPSLKWKSQNKFVFLWIIEEGQNPREKKKKKKTHNAVLLSPWNECNHFSKQSWEAVPWSTPCLHRKASTAVNQSTISNHQPIQFRQNQITSCSTLLALKSWRLSAWQLLVLKFHL